MKVSDLVHRRGFILGGAGMALSSGVPPRGVAEGQPAGKPRWSLPATNQVRREFDRIRSRKVVYAAHCMLNQNARITTAADFPAMFEPLVDWLKAHNIGIVQMPCPELRVLGLGRVTVREGLETAEGHKHLHELIDDLIFEIKEYQFQAFDVVGILGKQGSPSCGVTQTWLDERQQEGVGVFIRLFRERLDREGLDVEILGVADHKQQEAIDWLAQRI